MQYSAFVNEAHATLRAPLTRALYLLQLHGLDKDEVFNVVLNIMGKKLGKEMNRNWVEVIGSVCIEDGENWLEVKRYEEVDYLE